MNSIALDIGASFVKAALFDENGTVLSKLQRASPKVHGSEDIFSLVQISALVSLVKEILSELTKNIKESKLCVSNEMHGFILAHADGSPCTDYISWQKEYGSEVVNGTSSVEILACDEYKDFVKKSGMGIRAGLPSSNLLYLICSEKLKKWAEEPLHFYTLGDYLVKALFCFEPLCHPTNAAATGLYDLEAGTWNYDFIKAIGAEKFVFPKISEEPVSCNFCDSSLSVYPAIGDQQAALLGAGLSGEGDLSFNLGTGAQVSLLSKNPDFSEKWQIRPFFNGFYLKTIPHLPSGRALNVFVRFVKDILCKFDVAVADERLWAVLLSEAEKCEKPTLSCDLSFFQNPLSANTVGSVTNIAEYALSVGSLFKSVFSKMADNFLAMANLLAPERDNVQRLVFSGGIARKIRIIRDAIISQYKNAEILPIIENETLAGLYKYGNQAKKLHIIWDLDGTLIDSAPEIKEVLDKSIKECGFSHLEQKADFRSGPPLDLILDEMYASSLSEHEKSSIIAAFRKNYDNCGFNHTPPFDGIEKILSDSRFVHHIVTNKPDLATARILEKLGWEKYFDSVITPYSFMKSADDNRKTKPELFDLCMADFPGEKFVGIGDMDTDAKAALENKIPAIGVLWGTGTDSELRECGCTHIARSVDELKTILADYC